MKRLLLILCLSLSYNFCGAQTQSLPYIASPTIIPQSPTSSDVIRIITMVTTPNQGVIVDMPSYTVTQSPKEIKIRGCYGQTMLPATQNFVDTFVVGQLPSGVYTVKHKAFLSSANQHCAPTDSNMVMATFTVATLTSLKEFEKSPVISVFPVPAKELIHLANTSGYTRGDIYSYSGSLLRTFAPGISSEVKISDLAPGLYFIRFSGPGKNECTQFIKE